jgi:hypothetical protein
MISARFFLRIKIHQSRRLLISDLLMGAAWCAALTTATFDIVFFKKRALDPKVDYTLTNYDASVADFEYVGRVRPNSVPILSFTGIAATNEMIVLTVVDGLGQCHTLLRNPLSLQVVARGCVLPVIPSLHDQAANSTLDHTGILYQLVGGFHGTAALLVHAHTRKLVSTYDLVHK